MRGPVMRGVVLGLERRRRWRDEDKARIVASVGVGGVTVTQLAHHHEVTRQQIYSWRHELKKKGLLAPSADVAFLPVDILDLRKPPEAPADMPVAPSMVELRLRNGRSLHFEGAMDAAILARLIQVVETA
jgi:transposase